MCNDPLLLRDLKLDLGISSEAFDNRLASRLATAKQWIEAEGCTLSDSEADRELVVMYAAWLWRSRVTGEGMGRMLRSALNNRIFGEKARSSS